MKSSSESHLFSHIVVKGLRLAAVVAGVPTLGGGAVKVPEHAGEKRIFLFFSLNVCGEM